MPPDTTLIEPMGDSLRRARYFATIVDGLVGAIVRADLPEEAAVTPGLVEVTDVPNPEKLGGYAYDGSRFTPPVVEVPVLVATQLDRIEALLLEIKGAVVKA